MNITNFAQDHSEVDEDENADDDGIGMLAGSDGPGGITFNNTQAANLIGTVALAFILCFLLSDKAVRFAKQYETTMQIVEAFVWTFGDANSILLASLLLPAAPAPRLWCQATLELQPVSTSYLSQ